MSKTCMECKNIVFDAAKFCSNCGAKFKTEIEVLREQVQLLTEKLKNIEGQKVVCAVNIRNKRLNKNEYEDKIKKVVQLIKTNNETTSRAFVQVFQRYATGVDYEKLRKHFTNDEIEQYNLIKKSNLSTEYKRKLKAVAKILKTEDVNKTEAFTRVFNRSIGGTDLYNLRKVMKEKRTHNMTKKAREERQDVCKKAIELMKQGMTKSEAFKNAYMIRSKPNIPQQQTYGIIKPAASFPIIYNLEMNELKLLENALRNITQYDTKLCYEDLKFLGIINTMYEWQNFLDDFLVHLNEVENFLNTKFSVVMEKGYSCIKVNKK